MMLLVFRTLLIFSVIIMAYTYVGYALIVWLLIQFKKLVPDQVGAKKPPYFIPRITMIVSAYNEEEIIEAKIINSLRLDYPKEAIQLLFISDGSTDNTSSILARHTGFIHLHQRERKGKLHAMNRAMAAVKTPFVVFSDANSMLNPDAITRLVQHYSDPRVGGVAGEKKVFSRSLSVELPLSDSVGMGEGLYWRYESLLKKMDSALYSTVGAAGELFSIRTELYEQLPADTILEDFVQSLLVCLKGYIIRYEPGAWAAETASADLNGEAERKIRISAGGFQAMSRLSALFNPFRKPVLTFQYFSHRVLRWTLAPLSLIICLFSSIVLWWAGGGRIYELLCLLQIAFFGLALTGWLLVVRGIKFSLTYFPFYFCMMNFCVFAGFVRWIRGTQPVVWSKARRA
jgi:poly-beta-1,6-N-acetyl-D-glucosamine synthase